MYKSFKYRLYPTIRQSVLLDKHIGACRFVYNLALETKRSAYIGNKKVVTSYDLMDQLSDLKNECLWLKEINAQSLQQSIKNLDYAYKRFFSGNAKFPRFKNKKSNKTFKVPQYINVKNNKLFFPKFKEGINIVLHRPIEGKIKQATIIKNATGKYFVSFFCEIQKDINQVGIDHKRLIGIDLGLKSFLVTSNGLKIDNPSYLRSNLNRLNYLHKKHSKYGGNRTKQKLVLLYEKIGNQKKDFLNKLSTELIKNHDSIAVEDLNIKGMVKNHSLSMSISSVGWGSFLYMLNYKAKWNGKNILAINMFDPSSKKCSKCGSINNLLRLHERTWVCKSCGKEHDRDINAAINIKNFAISKYLFGEPILKNQKELPAVAGAMTSEVHCCINNEQLTKPIISNHKNKSFANA